MRFQLHFGRAPWVIALVIALAVVLMAASAPPCAAQQQPDDLEKQLQQLKQQYDATTHDLEKRIATLEQKIQRQKEATEKAEEKTKEGRAISTVELAAERAAKTAVLGQADQVSAKYQGALPSEPTYDLLQDAESKIANLKEQVGAFEFHGYFRSGYGLNSDGGQQVRFKLPAPMPNTDWGPKRKLAASSCPVNNWLNLEHLAWRQSVDENGSDDQRRTPRTPRVTLTFQETSEMTSSACAKRSWRAELLEHLCFCKVLGRRAIFRRRQHIGIDDFYPLDMSGYGAGVEDVDLRIGKMSVAFLAGARPDLVTQSRAYAKSNIDVRFYDLKGPAGLWAAWFSYTAKTGEGRHDAKRRGHSDFGWLRVQVVAMRLEWHGGYHALSIQYGKGAASNFSTSIDDPTPFLKNTERLLIAEHLLVQPN